MSIESIAKITNHGAFKNKEHVYYFKFLTLLRCFVSAIACFFIILYVLTSETRRDDYTILVKDFTALIILVDLDNNLTSTHLTGSLNNKKPSRRTLEIMLNNHKKFIQEGIMENKLILVFDNLVFFVFEFLI